IYLFIVFQGLLKDSFERKDLESFNLYKKTVVELFDHLGVGIKPEDVKKEINERRAQMFLHLASWLMHQIELSDDNNVYRAFYETIDLENSKNIKIFDEIFWQTYNSETGGFWGWSSWGLEADGKVHEIDLHGRLERYYIVKLLFFLSKMTSQEISNFKLQPHRHFKYLLDNDGAFTIFINSLEGNLGKWNSFIDEGMKDRVDILKEKLKLVRNEYVEKELQNKRKAKISSGKKDKFKREVLLSLKETPSIRGVLGYYDLISHKAEFRIEEKRFGLNTAFDKEAFLDKTGVSYGTWGKGYGKTLAMGETSFVLNKIEEKCGSVENIDKMESIISNSDNWIILSTDYDYLMRLNEMDNVSSKWHDRDFQELSKEHEGYYHLNGKEIPIFYLPRKDNKKQVFVLNMKKFGELCFYNPLNKNEDKELVEDWLYISIQAYSQDKDLLDSSLEKPTDWLSNKGSKDEQRNHLLELVLINILEKIEYIPSSDFEGFLLNV
ncbi:MAG: hypothetical protein KAT05_06670, partial [Spirochaetes bacterium]|nr:hypothetical protein [Spirochaetota bacterium]